MEPCTTHLHVSNMLLLHATCRITITYIDKEGKEHTVKAPLGKNLLEVAHDNEIDLEGTAVHRAAGMR